MGKTASTILVVLIAVAIVLGNSLYRVWETEQVVITKFGKPVATITEPGLKFKVPFIYKTNFFENRLLDYDSAPTEILTMDKKTLIVDNFAKWRIINPLLFLQTVQNENGAQTRLDDIIYSELRAEIGRNIFHDIISGKRVDIMKEVTRQCDVKAEEYGIEIVDVQIKRADLPQENERAIYDRMTAERNRIASQYRSEGEEEALKIRAETDKEAAIIIAEAEKKAEEIKGDGDAQATAIYADAYNRDKAFYSFMRTLQAYEKTIDSTTTLIMSPSAEFFEYLWKSP